MDYTITDDEYNALHYARGQLNFVSGLLCQNLSRAGDFSADDMNCFVSAQADSLNAVLKSVDARSTAAYEEQKSQSVAPAVLTPNLEIDVLTDILQVVAGSTNREEQLLAINSKLLDAAMVNTAYGSLLRLYYGMLQNAGVQIETTTRNGVVQTYVKAPAKSAPKGRKRDKLAGMQRGAAHAEAV